MNGCDGCRKKGVKLRKVGNKWLCTNCRRVHVEFPFIGLIGTLTDDGYLLESGDLISNGKFIPKSRGPLIKVK
jgi:hypothetical protein